MTLHLNNFLSWVQVKEPYVNDGGTWRSIREVYVNDGGTWRSIFVRGLTGATLIAANIPSSGGIGYSVPDSAGSMSQTTLSDGKSVYYLSDESGSRIILSIQGFSANPGQSYLTSLTIGGQGTLLAVNAIAYIYTLGVAQWEWEAPSFVLVNGGNYTVTIEV